MSKKLSEETRKAFVGEVRKRLVNVEKSARFITKLDNEKDMVKCYNLAKRYNVRFGFKLINGTGDSRFNLAMSEESNDEFLREIEKADESSLAVAETEVIKESSKGIEILRKALDYGVTTFQLDFLKGYSISVDYVGNKEDKNVYYCSGIDSFLSVG
jgi:ribonuclease HII